MSLFARSLIGGKDAGHSRVWQAGAQTPYPSLSSRARTPVRVEGPAFCFERSARRLRAGLRQSGLHFLPSLQGLGSIRIAYPALKACTERSRNGAGLSSFVPRGGIEVGTIAESVATSEGVDQTMPTLSPTAATRVGHPRQLQLRTAF